jgi:hypothetical protein
MNGGAAYLNRFDFKIRTAGHLSHPLNSAVFEIGSNSQAHQFKRVFGEVSQFSFTSGFLHRIHLKLTAISLEPPQNEESVNADILQQISGPSGIDVADHAMHCIGIFAPSGWPEERRGQAEIRGNALFYLVQKEEGTRWSIFGPKGPLKQLFDPETAEEKMARARSALDANSGLILPGDQVGMDAFLKEHQLEPTDVLDIIRDSHGILKVLEYKGKNYIQHCIR